MKTTLAFAVRKLGLIEFEKAWALQREIAGRRENTLLLLEHPPVFTLGKNADVANVLNAGGIPVVRIDRGGDVTYHGPGQLVGYPILDLRAARIGVREHVRRIEDAIIAALADVGVEGRSRNDAVGVWTKRGKIASLGIRVAQGMSMHGFALNVSNDLAPFGSINPCGVAACAVASVSGELGRRAETDELGDRFIANYKL